MGKYAVYVTMFVDADSHEEAEEIISNEILDGIIHNPDMKCEGYDTLDSDEVEMMLPTDYQFDRN